jgi:hypothetical protein
MYIAARHWLCRQDKKINNGGKFPVFHRTVRESSDYCLPEVGKKWFEIAVCVQNNRSNV